MTATDASAQRRRAVLDRLRLTLVRVLSGGGTPVRLATRLHEQLLNDGWTAPRPSCNCDPFAACPHMPASPTWQWAWREANHPDAVPVPASEATARKQAELDPDTELVRRPVGPWEVIDRG